MGQSQASPRLDVPVRVLLQDRAQEGLVLLAEAGGDPLADRAELVAPDMIAPQECESPDPRIILAHDLDRPGGVVDLPNRLDQGIHRDRVLRVFPGQLYEPER